ncbi:unnamed protein product [Plutella xylostella]|uniref:(diamondback moth) hypothetical protein n=1 Tax=Plutella xylostella TaxID=51655 RepID=A0A8S4DJ59_PLUXY|nr:unnamed protein product [Plutella xylostella]
MSSASVVFANFVASCTCLIDQSVSGPLRPPKAAGSIPACNRLFFSYLVKYVLTRWKRCVTGKSPRLGASQQQGCFASASRMWSCRSGCSKQHVDHECGRYMEDEFPAPRGAKKSTTSKYLLGGTVLAFVIAIIWFPLVFFAFGNTVGEPNPPTDVTVKIRIGPFLPVYQMSAQAHNIDVFTEAEYSQLSNLYARDRTAQTFLSNYMFNDVAVVSINPNSTSKWEISPPELDRLEREAVSNATISVKFSYIITHPSNSANNPPTIEDSREVPMEAYIDGEPNPEREKLLKMLSGQASDDTWLNIKKLFPKFLKVFNKGTAKPLYQLSVASPGGDADNRYYRDVQLRLERDRAATYWRVRELCDTQVRIVARCENCVIVTTATCSCASSETAPPPTGECGNCVIRSYYRDVQLRLERDRAATYWRVRELCDTQDPLLSIPLNNCDMLVMYTFNDKLFPETLNFISGGGIIGLYTTFVFLASRVLRGFFSGIYSKIMFDDLPNVDRVLQLCLDIYLVREAMEMTLEEDLFAKLVFLYRSPETMIKWSRPKEEEGNEEPRAIRPPPQ